MIFKVTPFCDSTILGSNLDIGVDAATAGHWCCSALYSQLYSMNLFTPVEQ